MLLGAISPSDGSVIISGNTPADAIKKWPGAIAYVPQNVMVCEGTVRENIALGFPDADITDDLLLSAIRIAHLDQFIGELPNGLESYIESKGTNLSGGQRQRIGIARAMFTRPRLLVLDEATSALDGQTEAYISDAIQALKGDVTVITIAHRLSTVREADAVVYLDRGVVAAIGSFDEVRRAIPDFDDQAKLMGL